MKALTENEVAFVKETGFTPTVWQCGEYYRTIFTKEKVEWTGDDDDYSGRRQAYEEHFYNIAKETARNEYNVDLDNFIQKNLSVDLNDYDSISLEYVAAYLFYLFFTEEELLKLTDEEATKFLKDYRYYFGFRKWDGGNLGYVNDAIRAHRGEIEFYETEDGNVWWRECYE